MSWAKIDDQFADHPKIVTVGPLAAWLHTAAINYCARYLTDGFVPAAAVGRLASFEGIAAHGSEGWQPVRLAGLVTALLGQRLWEACEGGYMIHDYLEYNPSREQVCRERETNARRMSAWRHRGQQDRVTVNGPVCNAPTDPATGPATGGATGPAKGGATDSATGAATDPARDAPVANAPYPSPSPRPISAAPADAEAAAPPLAPTSLAASSMAHPPPGLEAQDRQAGATRDAAPVVAGRGSGGPPLTCKTAAGGQPRDPNLDHPAVAGCRELTHLTPDATQRAEIARCVTDLDRWDAAVRTWVMRGNKKSNVDGMLQWYRDGIPQFTRSDRGYGAAKPGNGTDANRHAGRRDAHEEYDNTAALSRI